VSFWFYFFLYYFSYAISLYFRVPAGELAAANYYQLQKLLKALSNYITKDDFSEHSGAIRVLQANQEKYKDEIAQFLQILTLLQKETLEHQEILNLHESLLQNKLDKSELQGLQSLTKIMLLYESFKNTTEQKLDDLSEFKQKTNNTVSKLEESSAEQAETILMINKELPKLATKKDIFIIAKELKEHSNRLDSCALASTLEELEEKVIRISQALEETQLLLGEAGKDIEVIQKILPSKASSNEMQKRVLTEKFEAYQKMLSESMNLKASASTAEALQTSLQVFPCLSFCFLLLTFLIP
jgi:hypothetical protein